MAAKLLRGGHYKKSIDAYEECLHLDNCHALYNSWALCDRSTCFLYLGKEKEAIRDLTQALHLNPKNLLASLRLRRAYVCLGSRHMVRLYDI